MSEEKDTYRYKLVNKRGVVLKKGWTYDIDRRECEEKARYPDARVKRIGKKVTHSQAIKWLDEQSQVPAVEVASIPTKNYKEVIEVRVPIRFYWNEDGSFDGIEFGAFKTTLQPWQEDMIRRCLEAIKPAIEVDG